MLQASIDKDNLSLAPGLQLANKPSLAPSSHPLSPVITAIPTAHRALVLLANATSNAVAVPSNFNGTLFYGFKVHLPVQNSLEFMLLPQRAWQRLKLKWKSPCFSLLPHPNPFAITMSLLPLLHVLSNNICCSPYLFHPGPPAQFTPTGKPISYSHPPNCTVFWADFNPNSHLLQHKALKPICTQQCLHLTPSHLDIA